MWTRACRDHGFFLLLGHGLDEVNEGMWAAARQFFSAPREVKRSVLRDADNPMGFYDRELTKRKRDQKEVFDFKCGGTHVVKSGSPASLAAGNAAVQVRFGRILRRAYPACR